MVSDDEDQARPGGAGGWIWRFPIASVAVAVLGCVLAVPPSAYPALQRIGEDFNMLDGSWTLELPARLARGELAGRDFVFNCGPLWQFVHALGLIVPPGDVASLLRFLFLPETVLGALCAWVLVAFTGAPWTWRARTYLLWVIIFSGPDVTGSFQKPMFGLLAVVLCGRTLAVDGNGMERSKWWHSLLAWMLSVPLLVLYSPDLGIAALAALVATALVTLVATYGPAPNSVTQLRMRTAGAALAAVFGFAVFGLLLSQIRSWSGYLPNSWVLARGYAVLAATHCAPRHLIQLTAAFGFAALVLAGAVFRLRHGLRQGSPYPKRTLAILASACFCAVWLRYGLTRSDLPHIKVALVPSLFLLGCLLPCYFRAEGMRVAWPSLAAWLLIVVLSPHGSFGMLTRATKYRILAISGLELRSARLEISHPAVREAAAAAAQLAGDSLYVWPNETIVALLAGKANPSYTALSISALSGSLERATIERLSGSGDVPALIFMGSEGVDGVEGLTRTPQVFRYLLEHYELAGEPSDQFAVLQRRQQAGGDWQEHEVPVERGSFTPGDGRAWIVRPPADGCRASDLILLRLRASKTELFGVAKPGRLWAIFLLSNGELRRQKLLLPPDGETHDVLVSALTVREPLFLSVFSRGQQWQSSERVVAIQLVWTPIDVLSRRPREIAIDGVFVLVRNNVQIVESPLAAQNDPLLRRRCYSEDPGPF